jgi:hypothetical protein
MARPGTLDRGWEQTQIKVFSRWCAKQLAQRQIQFASVTDEFSDGVKLCHLLEVVGKAPIPGKWHHEVKNRFQMLENIDFALNASLNQVVYDKINITNMTGKMSAKNGILTLQDVSANALGGSCKVSGSYDTSVPEKPKVNFALNLSKVSFVEAFKSVESIQKFTPVFENLIGSFSLNLNFNTSLGESLVQTLAGLTGNGALQTADVKVENVGALTALASTLSSTLKTDALQSFSAKDVNLPFSINDGRLTTKPFNIHVGNGGALRLEGSTGLDQQIDYKGLITLPKSLANNYVKEVPVTIGGTFTSPKIGIDLKALASEAAATAVSEVIGALTGADEPVDLSAEKAKQIEKLRTEADKAAARLVEEAEKQAKNLEDKAGNNPFAKAAAQVAGKKLIEEAGKQGEKLRNAAEEEIKKLE